ncbi:insulin-like growth factor-binding protein 1 isoform X2 [Manis pentadactyla]|uniref:insulin-like growth factor-binding protein 1 isoform X2 n=1 Tax=Manis pentadactyla TaxID=143292 RepID=UPI0018748126|nr:insulin-like growth factor-binding protein 1 isoform X2 [Manis pentadactyla]
MPEIPAARGWLLLLLAVQLGAAAGAPQPWHCAPCSAERLALCPPVPSSCPELARPAGCGCCLMCALPLGAACGVATARCARGLSCRALPGEPRPLHALTRGQGACTPDADAAPSAEDTGEDLPILWNAVSNYQSMKAREITGVKKRKEPCQRELYKVLDRLAKEQQKAGDELYKFYLPNCNKNGFYHSKQCETSLEGEAGLCWCVYPWNGKKIPGSLEIRGDPNCHQYFNLQN